MKVLEQIKTTYKEAAQLVSNVELFIEAVCLLIVAYTSYWTATNVDTLETHEKYVVLFASLLIGLRGALLLIQRINKK